MRRLLILILLVSSAMMMPRLYAKEAQTDEQIFEKLFSKWTDSFNHKDLVGACSLFSEKVVADYRGIAQKNHEAICSGFKKIFAEPNREYKYRFKLHNVYRSGDLAAARITWYLTISQDGKQLSVTEDQGLDVFEKNKDGRWQIVNYVAYPERVDADRNKVSGVDVNLKP